MYAIKTKYVGPTDLRGSRIKAESMCEPKHRQRAQISPDEFDNGNMTAKELHRIALQKLLTVMMANAVKQLGARRQEAPEYKVENWLAGWTDEGYVWVFVGSF